MDLFPLINLHTPSTPSFLPHYITALSLSPPLLLPFHTLSSLTLLAFFFPTSWEDEDGNCLGKIAPQYILFYLYSEGPKDHQRLNMYIYVYVF